MNTERKIREHTYNLGMSRLRQKEYEFKMQTQVYNSTCIVTQN